MNREISASVKYQQLLKNCELLEKMSAKSASSFLSLFHEEKWPKNTCILNQEKLVYHFYIILSGRVKMYQVDDINGKEVTLFLLTKNDVFDLYCLLDGHEHNVYYECLDNTRILAAPMEELRKWLESNPQHYPQILHYAGKQLRMLENFVSDITFTDISTRLLNLLLKNVNKNSEHLEVINDLSNKEIANLIGSTRAVVNRHLQKLKRNGAIKLYRMRMEIKSLRTLKNHLKEKNKYFP